MYHKLTKKDNTTIIHYKLLDIGTQFIMFSIHKKDNIHLQVLECHVTSTQDKNMVNKIVPVK